MIATFCFVVAPLAVILVAAVWAVNQLRTNTTTNITSEQRKLPAIDDIRELGALINGLDLGDADAHRVANPDHDSF